MTMITIENIGFCSSGKDLDSSTNPEIYKFHLRCSEIRGTRHWKNPSQNATAAAGVRCTNIAFKLKRILYIPTKFNSRLQVKICAGTLLRLRDLISDEERHRCETIVWDYYNDGDNSGVKIDRYILEHVSKLNMPRSQEVTPDRGVVQEFLTKLGGVAELTRVWCEHVRSLCQRLSNIRDPACLRPKDCGQPYLLV
ncbi:uncharacterized protein LOC119638697 [Glossina fuscipes]|uniref:Uncharacterized protein LOC119638697 n=1 Tax=Glossina fuscipes TaxID=7396 RepID=A0A9C6DU48_9MUSC|nr:uncharacterized protein LOC119638697 [Glossina fuscipes]